MPERNWAALLNESGVVIQLFTCCDAHALKISTNFYGHEFTVIPNDEAQRLAELRPEIVIWNGDCYLCLLEDDYGNAF